MNRKFFRNIIKGLFGGFLFAIGAFYARKFDLPFGLVILSISFILAFLIIIDKKGKGM